MVDTIINFLVLVVCTLTLVVDIQQQESRDHGNHDKRDSE